MTSDIQKQRARQMRLQPTSAERILWRRLRHDLPLAGSHFRRQPLIGPYIVDFASRRQKIVIELDGGQHATPTPADAARTEFIEAQGYRMLRFWNHDVIQNSDGVLEMIATALTPTPDPSPQGGGEKSTAAPVIRPVSKRGLLNLLETMTPIDEQFPDVDRNLPRLRDIKL